MHPNGNALVQVKRNEKQPRKGQWMSSYFRASKLTTTSVCTLTGCPPLSVGW
jgi:hypothetical protein